MPTPLECEEYPPKTAEILLAFPQTTGREIRVSFLMKKCNFANSHFAESLHLISPILWNWRLKIAQGCNS